MLLLSDQDVGRPANAENLVAAFQGKPARLLGRAASAADARVLLEALEVGTAGVVLQPDSPAEARRPSQRGLAPCFHSSSSPKHGPCNSSFLAAWHGAVPCGF